MIRRPESTIARYLLGASGIALFTAAWELLAALGAYNTSTLPPPSRSLASLWAAGTDGILAMDTQATLYRYFLGLIIGVLLGATMGTATGSLRSVGHVAAPLFHYFRALPLIALLPVVLAIFGIGDVGRIALVAWGAFFPTWLGVHAGILGEAKEYAATARGLGASGMRTVFLVQVPAAFYAAIPSIRIAIGTAFFALAAAESSGAQNGITTRIFRSYQNFDTSTMLGYLIFLGLLVMLIDKLFIRLANRAFSRMLR